MRMTKVGLALCVSGLLAAAAVPAFARLAANGESLNGVSLNGENLNGHNLNGIRLNGATAETGVSLSGVRALDGRLVR